MSFWKPGTVAPGSSIDREAETNAGAADGNAGAVTGRVVGNLSISDRRDRLPIAKNRDALLYLLEQHAVVILQSPTGTGKSTQMPQFLMEAGWASKGYRIGVTQPRRLAAVSVAQRTAEEAGCVLGDEVGYQVRFEAMCSDNTKILFLTDGMLFREILVDPLLSKYSVIMIDEAHERSVYTDLLLGVLKKIRLVRPSLRIIISSATIDAQSFVDYFNTIPPSSNLPSFGVLAQDEQPSNSSAKMSRWDRKEKGPAKDAAVIAQLEGTSFPVEVAYLQKATADYVKMAVTVIFDIHLKMPPGDILVFLTGREEIDRCVQQIADELIHVPSGVAHLMPVALHAGLSVEMQMAVFNPSPPRTRKVVISTNVAEASVTIEGIKYVVDSGLVKLRSYNPLTGMDSLVVCPCSLASLQQRKGRAGRTSPGKCFRLFPQTALTTLLPTTPPELTRTDLSLVLLQLKSLGIQNVLRFDWLTPPSSRMMESGLEFLYCLGALDDEGRLTKPLGERMAEMPIDVMMSKILLDSHIFGCSEEILTVAAMSSVQNVFLMDIGDTVKGEIERRKFTVEEGDHITNLNAFNAFYKVGRKSSKWCHNHRLNFKALSRAMSIRTQLKKYLQRFNIPIISCEEDHTKLRRCLTSGYFRNAAKLQPDGSYRSIRENAVLYPHPSSVLFSRIPSTQYVIYHEVVETTKRFMRDITTIEQDWLTELAPHYYSIK